MPAEPNDWRLQGQEGYLSHRTVLLRPYVPESEQQDHEHCDFCWQKFSLREEDEHEGYVTLDGGVWICRTCFQDFQEMFSLRLFHPRSFDGKTLPPILTRECPPIERGSGFCLAQSVLRVCELLMDARLVPLPLRIVPAVMTIRFPNIVRVLPLEEYTQVISGSDPGPNGYCAAVKGAILALTEREEIQAVMEGAGRGLPSNQSTVCVKVESAQKPVENMYFVPVPGLAELESRDDWEGCRKLLANRLREEPESVPLLCRLIAECWYVLVMHGCMYVPKDVDLGVFSHTLKAAADYGLEHCMEDFHFLWQVGYMMSLFPYLFGAEWTEGQRRGAEMMQKALHLRPKDLVVRVLNLGNHMGYYEANAVRKKMRVWERVPPELGMETEIEQYFRDIITRVE